VQSTLQTILVIDDEDIVRRSFCDSLEDMGYRALGVNNGEVGLELAIAEQPDLILTDLRMPVMGGLEFLASSTVKLPDTPIIVISGAGLMGDVVEALRLGAYDYLTKPVRDPDLLQAAVGRALEQVALRKENKQYQLHLEGLVSQRTAELINANQELEMHKNNLEAQVRLRTSELESVIFDLHSAQEQLIESAKMASLGRLVAGVSHELNTPLGICLTYISSLGQKVNNFEKQFHKGELRRDDFERFLSTAQDSSELVINHLSHASELVQNFKMVSVDVSSDMKRGFNLVDYVQSVVQSLKSETLNVVVDVRSNTDQNFQVYSYPGFFSQIFTNLLLNSVLHGFDSLNSGNVSIGFEFEDESLRIVYQDNGKGMSKEVKQQVFEPFFTTARGEGGSGLGMNILYNLIVNNLSGSVVCTSEPDQGVQFDIKIPRAMLVSQ
jgi:signal transduction histidine kinase